MRFSTLRRGITRSGFLPLAVGALTVSSCGVGASKGTLVADVGMTLDEVARRSSLKVVPGFRTGLTGSHLSIAEIVFDLEIGVSGARFPRCRYYWLEAGPHDDPKLAHLNIGVSTLKMPLAQMEVFEERAREELKTHGFRAGHFVNRTERELQLSGGKKTYGEGRYYARGDSLVIFARKRVDDEKPGEDPQAGQWILYFDIVPRTDGTYGKLVYDP